MVPSLDSDSPFRRGPLVDLQRVEDLGYKFSRNYQYFKKKSGRYKHNTLNLTKGRTICRRRVKFIFCNRVTKSEISTDILNLNLQTIDLKNVITVRRE